MTVDLGNEGCTRCLDAEVHCEGRVDARAAQNANPSVARCPIAQ
jgi:hypothetical protein